MKIRVDEQLRAVEHSISELENWKFNRERKAEQRALEGGYGTPMTSDALSRAIHILKQYQAVLKFFKKRNKQRNEKSN